MYFAKAATLQSRVAGDVHECFLFINRMFPVRHSRAYFFCLFYCNFGFVLKRACARMCYAVPLFDVRARENEIALNTFSCRCAHDSRDLVLPASEKATSRSCCCFVE